jgi:hypothetical protein
MHVFDMFVHDTGTQAGRLTSSLACSSSLASR